MFTKTGISKSCLVFVLMSLLVTHVLSDEPPELPISGLVGMTAGLESGWLAIKVDFSEDEALSGILWYNNDCSVVFPKLLVGTGYTTNPGLVSEALPVTTNISGESLQQSEVVFDQPVGASLDGLYVIFEFPAGVAFTAEGTGGGPAVGYYLGDEGSHGWISGDGENWLHLADDYRFSIVPVLVPFVEGMAIKSMDAMIESQPQEEVVEAAYFKAGPNPFNPQVELKFGLPKGGDVELSIFNLRGERIVRLVSGFYAPGHHSVTWAGANAAGQKMASGVYFARFVNEELVLTRRLMLIK